jgi:hypothetical protein
VYTAPFGVERVSACWPRKPMRVMRFLQSMFLSSFRAPIRWGDPVRRGPLSKQAKRFFGGSTADCLCRSKGAAGNLQGKPKPARAGTGERSCRARGITLKPSPTKREAERQTSLQDENRVSIGPPANHDDIRTGLNGHSALRFQSGKKKRRT